jgi:O-antigen ligase
MVAAGAAGVAALNVNRLLTVSLRTGKFWEALAAYIPTLRISSVFPDLNAAGSYLAMTVLLSGGLIFAGRRAWASCGWFIGTFLILGALWLTGSRAALVAALVAAVLMLAVTASLKGRSPLWPALIGTAVLTLMALAIAQFSENAGRPLSEAASIRAEFARTGLRMFSAHPVFGAGVGRYYLLSTEFSSAQLRSVYLRENAHNNFLQMLAELGIVGLSLFLWILVAIGRHAWPALVASRASPVLVGAVGGLSAFLLTCLFGHPLLIPEVAYAFWLVLGVTVGLAQEIPTGADLQRVTRWWTSRRLLVGAATLLLVVSVPIRSRQMLAEENLEHAAIGFSDWQTDSEGVSFRWMIGHAQFYVPTTANAVGLPLRLEAAGGSERSVVEVYLEGHLATRIRLERGAWQNVRFLMPQARPGKRFWRIELTVPATPDGAGSTGDAAARPRVQVGRLELTMSRQ